MARFDNQTGIGESCAAANDPAAKSRPDALNVRRARHARDLSHFQFNGKINTFPLESAAAIQEDVLCGKELMDPKNPSSPPCLKTLEIAGASRNDDWRVDNWHIALATTTCRPAAASPLPDNMPATHAFPEYCSRCLHPRCSPMLS